MGTGRARGKHETRKPEITPDSGEGREIGMSDRNSAQGTPSPIPGGRDHITNAQTFRQQVPVPDSPPEIKPVNAHGVDPGTHTARERAEFEQGPNHPKPIRPAYQPQKQLPPPVPVYTVEAPDAPKVFRSAAPHHITLQASTGEPVRLCGRDNRRTNVLLLNESTSSDIRFGQSYADLTNGGGALLPWPGNSYLKLETQDELWGISKDSGTPVISIIQEFEQPW